jgi:hypothetical protein
MKKIIIIQVFVVACILLNAQVPQGFNYQAVARGSDGKVIVDATFQVRISILTDTTGFVANDVAAGYYVWEEQQTVTTNNNGLFTLAIGDTLKSLKTGGTAAKFSTINWTGQKLYIGVKINYPVPPGTYKRMGSAKLWSVPYAMVSAKSDSAKFLTKGTKLAVVSGNDLDTNALFLVKRKDGQTVFAVYPDAVNIYVPRGSKSATKGGFAIGGFNSKLGPPHDYFRVTPDSVRIYINNTPPPGKSATKGGFAIGGFNDYKGLLPNYYMNVTGANAVNTVESAAQILWYPNKQAFLAGNVHIGSVDSVGTNSTALGYKSIAMGNYSQAFGFKTMVLGDYSTAIGKNAIANKINSFAFGENAKAMNDESYAFGRGAIAEGLRSFAFGSAGVDSAGTKTGVAYAKGDYSFAMGQGSQALGFSSFAFGTANTASGGFSQAYGLSTEASGHTSTTFGYKTKATDWVDMAIGVETIASGHHSFAGGYGSKATSFQSFAFGKYTIASGGSSVAMGVNTRALGINSFAIGDSAVASQNWSVAMGRRTLASNYASMAIGSSTVASGGVSFAGGASSTASSDHAFAFGYNTLASGGGSVALGDNSKAIGNISFAMGDSAIAGMAWSIALGNRTLANGYASMAGGIKCKATENHSFAFGYNTLASGPGSVALGEETRATNGAAFTIGNQTHANGWGSVAFGNGTIANSYAAVVLGRFNDTTGMTNSNWYVSTDPAFEIGNGTSNTDRENAFTVLQNSNVGIGMPNPQQKLDIAEGNGRVQSGYNWLTNSDIRFKKNVVTLENSLEKVIAMRGVSFNLINSNSGNEMSVKNIGFIAQELEKVVPEVVVTGSDGFKSVAYDKITAVLTEAIKEQQQQIDTQRKEIDKLKALVNTLIANQTEQGNK